VGDKESVVRVAAIPILGRKKGDKRKEEEETKCLYSNSTEAAGIHVQTVDDLFVRGNISRNPLIKLAPLTDLTAFNTYP
jgi:hypothetical protein